jgi:hypothetical protein
MPAKASTTLRVPAPPTSMVADDFIVNGVPLLGVAVVVAISVAGPT